jgi:hypothetical protein
MNIGIRRTGEEREKRIGKEEKERDQYGKRRNRRIVYNNI